MFRIGIIGEPRVLTATLCYMMENKERIVRGDLCGGALCLNDRQGIISGTEGYIKVDNINCPEVVEVYRNYELVERYTKDDDMDDLRKEWGVRYPYDGSYS